MKKLYSISRAIFVALLFLIFVYGCSTVSLENPYETEYNPNDGIGKDDIYSHFNIHRGRWWNHYARGSWFLAGDHYVAARQDFRRAIKFRGEDKAGARTYGMHFKDYFPHRDSGIAFYLEGVNEYSVAVKEKLFQEAIRELTISIGQEPSSKAKFYLRLATEGYWTATQTDMKPPVISIANSELYRWTDLPTLYTNKYAAKLEIQASDSQSGIAAVSINDRELFIESVENDFNESTVVGIDPLVKTKEVQVKAVDLAGNKSWPVSVKLIVDTIPPTAAIRVNPDKGSMLNGRLRVEIAVSDDKGLKSIRIGDDPYDTWECHGQVKWEGTFYAKLGVRKLTVKVSDLAGNVTANDITLEPEQLISNWVEQYKLYEGPSLSYSGRYWDDIFVARLRAKAFQTRTSQFFPVQASYVKTTVGQFGMQNLASYQTRPAIPQLLLRDFQDSNSVQTSHNTYILQGEVRHAGGSATVVITVDNELLDAKRVVERGDYFIFSESIPLPDYGKKRSVVVQATAQDGTLIKEFHLNVERVSDYISEPNSVYGVVLLPLKEIQTPSDPYDLHKDFKRANNVVLDALRACKLYHPSDPNHSFPRFNCKALDTWDKMTDELNKLGVAESPPETKFTELANKYYDKMGLEIELGFFGEIIEDADSLEIILSVINIRKEEFLFRRIDIFGEKGDYEWCRDGLISKLQKTIRRFYGEVSCSREQGGLAVINCGRNDGVLQNMGVLLYKPSRNGSLSLICDATVEDVRRNSSAIQFMSNLQRNNVCDIGSGLKALAISK
jgi:hypothetical protein